MESYKLLQVLTELARIVNLFSYGNTVLYYMADWFRVQWLVNSRSVSCRTDR